jgi:hypothetical protein
LLVLLEKLIKLSFLAVKLWSFLEVKMPVLDKHWKLSFDFSFSLNET